jgi:hypothetical protein
MMVWGAHLPSTWVLWRRSEHGERMVGYRAEIVQYAAYACIAVRSTHHVCVLSNLTAIRSATIGINLMLVDDILDGINILYDA